MRDIEKRNETQISVSASASFICEAIKRKNANGGNGTNVFPRNSSRNSWLGPRPVEPGREERNENESRRFPKVEANVGTFLSRR